MMYTDDPKNCFTVSAEDEEQMKEIRAPFADWIKKVFGEEGYSVLWELLSPMVEVLWLHADTDKDPFFLCLLESIKEFMSSTKRIIRKVQSKKEVSSQELEDAKINFVLSLLVTLHGKESAKNVFPPKNRKKPSVDEFLQKVEELLLT